MKQNEPRIEQFIGQADGQWLLSEVSGLGADSLRLVRRLREVFARVPFPSLRLRRKG